MKDNDSKRKKQTHARRAPTETEKRLANNRWEWWTKRVLPRKGLNPSAKLVANVIAARINVTQGCYAWASVKYYAEEAGVVARTVSSAIDELESLGLITVENRGGGTSPGGTGRTLRIYLALGSSANLADLKSEEFADCEWNGVECSAIPDEILCKLWEDSQQSTAFSDANFADDNSIDNSTEESNEDSISASREKTNRDSDSDFRQKLETELAFDGAVFKVTKSDIYTLRQTYGGIQDLSAELKAADSYYSDKPPPPNRHPHILRQWMRKAEVDESTWRKRKNWSDSW